jgi:hypothetical protein
MQLNGLRCEPDTAIGAPQLTGAAPDSRPLADWSPAFI